MVEFTLHTGPATRAAILGEANAIAPEGHSFLLSALPPTGAQKRLALIIAGILFAAFLLSIPPRHEPLARVDTFIPIVDTVLFFNDLITSVLLFAQFSLVRSRAVLALAIGYLFSAAMIVPHLLTFPGAFTPNGLLSAGPSTTIWLYIFWHVALPFSVIAYTLLDRDQPAVLPRRDSARSAIVVSAAVTLLLAGALTWLVTIGANAMPALMVDAITGNGAWMRFGAPSIAILTALAIVLLWWRRSSILDLWLLLALWAWLIETLLLLDAQKRFTVGWYTGRTYGLLSSFFVLLVLLSESTLLYIRLAWSLLAQNREREARLISMEVVSAGLAHEIKQPLGAMVAHAGAGLRWLDRTPSDLGHVREALKEVVADGHRANAIVQSIRDMFSRRHQEEAVDVGELIAETVSLMQTELAAAGVATRIHCEPGLPSIRGDRGQLQQVLVNLVTNAIEAMQADDGRARILRVTSGFNQDSAVTISVEDSGPGIDPKDVDRIFEPFFTKKAKGTGIGLAICRSIVEAHGGTLSVSPGQLNGANLTVALPA